MGRRIDRRKKLGSHLKFLRDRAALSQAALAAEASKSLPADNRLSQTDISKIEAGKRWPSVPQLAALLRVLGVEDSVLAQFTDNAG